mmetsp:Transcript_33356/g.105722  ORF Transcript_33356/g.105722 Transcript_33356/m.105722 type:complete len:654 (-) Transcript_33356:73-2034(-)
MGLCCCWLAAVVVVPLLTLLRFSGSYVTDRLISKPLLDRTYRDALEFVQGVSTNPVFWAMAHYNGVRKLNQRLVEGDIVNVGAGKGELSAAMALSQIRFGGPSRPLWLYDTFAGIPAPNKSVERPEDVLLWEAIQNGTLPPWHPEQPNVNHLEKAWWHSPIWPSQLALALTGYPMEMVRWVEGRVEDTLLSEDNLPEKIALLTVSLRWYESTALALSVLYPRLQPGGLLVVDDFCSLPAVRDAVMRFLQRQARLGRPPAMEGACTPTEPIGLLAWRSPAPAGQQPGPGSARLEELLRRHSLEAWDRSDALKESWVQHGYVVLDNLLPPELLHRFVEDARALGRGHHRVQVHIARSGAVSRQSIDSLQRGSELTWGALYRSEVLRSFLSEVTGFSLYPVADKDIEAYTLYYYGPGDEVDEHTDGSYTGCRMLSLGIGLINEVEEAGLELFKHWSLGGLHKVNTTPGRGVLYDTYVRHRVSAFGPRDLERVVASVRFATCPDAEQVWRWDWMMRSAFAVVNSWRYFGPVHVLLDKLIWHPDWLLPAQLAMVVANGLTDTPYDPLGLQTQHLIPLLACLLLAAAAVALRAGRPLAGWPAAWTGGCWLLSWLVPLPYEAMALILGFMASSGWALCLWLACRLAGAPLRRCLACKAGS